MLKAKCVVNATGAFTDAVRRLDDPEAQPMIAPSQGVHLVLDKSFLPGDTAIMVPRTSDGRVMFAIPWHDHALVGTTDTPITDVTLEPTALSHEVDFILETAARYLARRPSRSDVLSVFTGIRPLVKATDVDNTAALSRDHTIQVSKSGLLTIAGGKWTTYRRMAEDCIDHAATLAALDERPCVTRTLHVHGYHEQPEDAWAICGGTGRTRPPSAAVMESDAGPGRAAAPGPGRVRRPGRAGPSATRWPGRSTTSCPAARGPCC